MIIFLYGQDAYRGRQKVNELKEKFLREVDKSASSLTVIDGAKATIDEITNAIGAGSLLVKKRLLVIEQLFANKDQGIFADLYEYLRKRKQSQDDNILVFWDSAIKMKKVKNQAAPVMADSSNRDRPLAKKPALLFKFFKEQKYSQQFNLLNSNETVNWIKKETERRGGKVSHQAAQLLGGLVGNDLWQISQEIDKLISYKLSIQPQLTPSGAAIEVKEVENLVRGNFDQNIFALTDAIASNNKTLALRLLEEQSELGAADSYLVNMFIRQFKILLQIKQALASGHNQRQLASLLKLHPFIVQKGVSQASHFTLTALKNIFLNLVKTDRLIKLGQIQARPALDLMVTKL